MDYNLLLTQSNVHNILCKRAAVETVVYGAGCKYSNKEGRKQECAKQSKLQQRARSGLRIEVENRVHTYTENIKKKECLFGWLPAAMSPFSL